MIRSTQAWLLSKVPVIFAVVCLCVLLAAGTSRYGSVSGAWRMLHVSDAVTTFGDIRGLAGSIDCSIAHAKRSQEERDCLVKAGFIYPRVWLSLRYLGVRSVTAERAGWTIFVLTLTTFIALFSAKRWPGAFVVFLTVLSPPVLLGLERGNVDLIVFSLLVYGLFAVQQFRGEVKYSATSILILLLTLLKIFPVAGIAILMSSRKKWVTALLVGLLSFGLLLLTFGMPLSENISRIPWDQYWGFGSFPFTFNMAYRLGPGPREQVLAHHAISNILGFLLGGIGVLGGWLFRRKLSWFLPDLDFESLHGRIAMSGLAIFCFAFLAGANFAYRLIFLVGVLAFLVRDLDRGRSLRSLPICVLFLGFFWIYPRSTFRFQLLDGAVFLVSCAWLGATVLSRLIESPDADLRLPSHDSGDDLAVLEAVPVWQPS